MLEWTEVKVMDGVNLRLVASAAASGVSGFLK